MTHQKNNTGVNFPLSRSTLSQISAVTVKNIVLIGYGLSLGFPTILISDLSQRNVDDPLRLGPEGISWIEPVCHCHKENRKRGSTWYREVQQETNSILATILGSGSNLLGNDSEDFDECDADKQKLMIQEDGSINLITVPLGCLMSGVVTQPLGRRRSMQLLNIPYVATWLIYYFSTNVWHILVTLAIGGFIGGLNEAPVLTYVAEITQPHLRGTLAATASVSVSTGVMLEFILGKFMDWKSAALCSLIVPIVSFSLLFFIPETPSWLLTKKRYKEAKKSMAWLRGWVAEEDVEKEYEELLFNLKMNNQSKEQQIMKKSSKVKLFGKRNFIRPFILLTIACFLVHFCGLTPIQTYAGNIFTSLHSPIDARSATAILGVVNMIGSLFCVIIVRKCGRRITSFMSLSGTAITFFILGTYTHYFDINSLSVPSNLTKDVINATLPSSMQGNGAVSWFSFSTLIFGAFSAQMGIRILPWTLVGEVFPNEIRAFAAGLMGMNFYIFGFLCNKSFLKYVSLVNLPGTFWSFSAISGIGIVVLYFILPETEGKTLNEILEHYSGKSKLGNNIRKEYINTKEESEQTEKLNR